MPHSLSLSHSFKPSFPSFCQKRINKGKAAVITSRIDLSLSQCVCLCDLIWCFLGWVIALDISMHLSHTHTLCSVKWMTSHFCLSFSRNAVSICFSLSHALSQKILKIYHKHCKCVYSLRTNVTKVHLRHYILRALFWLIAVWGKSILYKTVNVKQRIPDKAKASTIRTHLQLIEKVSDW